jgi:hypothetical protein
LEHLVKIGEEIELRYKAIREMTCPDDEWPIEILLGEINFR